MATDYYPKIETDQKIQEVEKKINSITTGSFGPITPETAATFNVDGFATAKTEGDYVFAPGTANEVTITVTAADRTNAVVKINKKGTAYTKEIIDLGFEAITTEIPSPTSSDDNAAASKSTYIQTSAVQKRSNAQDLIIPSFKQVGYYWRNDGSLILGTGYVATYTEEKVLLKPSTDYRYEGLLIGTGAVLLYDKFDKLIKAYSPTDTPEFNNGSSQIEQFPFTTSSDISYGKFSSFKPDRTLKVIYLGAKEISEYDLIKEKVLSNENPKITESRLQILDTHQAIKGVEKSIYFDNILLNITGLNSYKGAFYCIDGKNDRYRFFLTPNNTTTRVANLRVLSENLNLIKQKNINIDVLDNTLATRYNCLYIGDSIGEFQNLPYFIDQLFKSKLVAGSLPPYWVGTNGGENGSGGNFQPNRRIRHESYSGKTSGFMVQKSAPNKFYNSATGTLDINNYAANIAQYYDENDLLQTGLTGVGTGKIDCVVFNIGYNDTRSDIVNTSFAGSMNNYNEFIAAVRVHNPNCKFVINLITLPSIDDPIQSATLLHIYKLKNNWFYRQQLLDNFLGTDSNIFIGDMGLCYNRYYAFPRNTTTLVNSLYANSNEGTVSDPTHPTEFGTREIAENGAPTILKALKSI
ncbi:hypothetical protein [Leeuwenhoekiella sp. MAR_2009_132]|uniref:hypothetical protein n=1 Tax=Leeuwenhoekiella sp. MAR_2009_132 TaxID=1392489 RepID=UPI0004903EB1|nr:hypothetical protein [Leeuwenhoekiella sp. MAR_2009_132]